MKRYFFSSIAICLFGFSSCKKDYTCDCTIVVNSDNGAGVTTNSTSVVPYSLSNAKKKDAESWCSNLDNSDESTTLGTTVTTVDYNCSLK